MEIIPKESSNSSKGLGFLFYFSLILFLSFVVSFFIFKYHVLVQAQKEMKTLEVILIEGMTPEKLAMERELLGYEKKIDKFSTLIARQTKGSKFFSAFEKVVHPQVWFSEISLNIREGIVGLSGHAKDLEVVEEQLLIIHNQVWFKSVSLEAISTTEGEEVNFNLLISFDLSLLPKN